MSEQDCIGRLSEALRLSAQVSDPATLAAELRSQLEQIQTLNRLDLESESLSLCFDVRWDH